MFSSDEEGVNQVLEIINALDLMTKKMRKNVNLCTKPK